MKEAILKKLGLSEQEVRIFLTLLRLGTSTASKIASETNIDRATTYRFLSSLIEKGIVSYLLTNNVRYFSAAHPSKLIEDLKEKMEKVNQIMPELENLINLPKEETKVELYKGKEGLKTIMKDILREKKPYTFVGEIDKFFVELDFYVYLWLREVEKKKIKGRLICNEEANFIIAKTEEYKLVSKQFISKISTFVYGNKTALFIWSNPLFGIVIENEDVANSNLLLFNFLWTLARNPNKKDLTKKRKREL